MNLVYGEIVALSCEREMQTGKVRVGGAIKTVMLDLVSPAQIGETILLCDGVAIAKVDAERQTENDYVPGDTGKTH